MEGVLDEVSARTTRLITGKGKRVHAPNRYVMEGAITSLTRVGRRMTTFLVGAAYRIDLDGARKVIVEAIASAPGVSAEPMPEAFVEEFGDSTINIACRFWHAPTIHAQWAARDEAMRSVKRAFDAAGATIAFP